MPPGDGRDSRRARAPTAVDPTDRRCRGVAVTGRGARRARASGARRPARPGEARIADPAAAAPVPPIRPGWSRGRGADFLARAAAADPRRRDRSGFALLEVLEYLHDPAWALRRCRESASRLIFTYHPLAGETIDNRRQRGWFSIGRPSMPSTRPE